MKKRVMIFFALLTAVLFTGCQATPEKPVVVQKDMEQMIETGMGDKEKQEPIPSSSEVASVEEPQVPKYEYAELCERYGVPERFQTTITEGNLTINCDVQIELPDTLTLPMVRVEAGRFSQEQVYALADALCGDTQMYLSPKYRDKAYYEQEIIENQAELAQESDEGRIRFLNAVIDGLKEQYEAAPDEIEVIPWDGTLQFYEIEGDKTGVLAGTQRRLNITSDPHNIENPMFMYVQNDIDYNDTSVYSFEDEFGNTHIVAPKSGSFLDFSREGSDTRFGMHCGHTKLADVTELSLLGGSVENCLLSTTPMQARDDVERYMEQLQLSEYTIDNVVLYTTKMEVPPMIVEQREDGSTVIAEAGKEEEKHAYLFRLLRLVDGVKVESTHGSSESRTEGMSFGKEWYYEELTIAVDDRGIANAYWRAPLDVTEVLTDDTVIRPFGEIAEIFEKMTVICSERYISPDREQLIEITHVSLSLQRIMERDSYTSGLLVPVWNFYGTVTEWDNEGQAYN